MTSSQPRVALIGCGAWGKNIARSLVTLRALVHVCDLDSRALDAMRQLDPTVDCSIDYRDLFRPTIDAVVIATPAATHHALAKAALLANKDVFVEKPMTLHPNEAAELLALAAERQRLIMVGHVLEYHPAVVKLRQLIEAGDLGEQVHYLYSHRLNLGKVRHEESALWSFAPHDIAVMLRIQHEMPTQVVSLGGAYIQPNIADVTVTHLLFANGARAHIFVSWLHPFKEQRLVIVGSRRMAVFDDVHKTLVVYERRIEIQKQLPVAISGTGEQIGFADTEPLLVEMQAWIQALQTRRPPLTDGASGLRTLQVLEAAHRSLLCGGTPQVPNNIVNDA